MVPQFKQCCGFFVWFKFSLILNCKTHYMISNEFSVKSVGTLKVILLKLSEGMRKAFHYK